MQNVKSTTGRLKEISQVILTAAPGITGDEYAAFLSIADNEGCCQRDVQDELGLTQSTTSRTMSVLNGRGHGLISSEVDPESRRRNNLRLSPKGKNLIAQLAVLLGCFAFAHSTLALADKDGDGVPDILDVQMFSPDTGTSSGPWDLTGHDGKGHYNTCLDIRTFRCDVI